jgi:hypothetical protein
MTYYDGGREKYRQDYYARKQRRFERLLLWPAVGLILAMGLIALASGCAIQSSSMNDGTTTVKIWSITPPMSKVAENASNWKYDWTADGSGMLAGNSEVEGLDMSGQVQTFMGGFAAARGMYAEYQSGKTDRAAIARPKSLSDIVAELEDRGYKVKPPPTSTGTGEF